MVTAKIHYNGDPSSVIPLPYCGHIGGVVTKDVRAVTCKLCRKRLLKAAKKSVPVPAYFQRIEPEPVEVGSLPFLTPETWRRIRDNCQCGKCDVCRFEAALNRAEHIQPWTEAKMERVRQKRFSSVAHALEVFVRIRLDGYPIGSSSSYDAYCELGLRVDNDAVAEPRHLAAADDCAEVERALAEAFDEHNSRGLEPDDCVAVLLARVVGRAETVKGRYGSKQRRYAPVPMDELSERFGLSKEALGGIVKSGKQRVYLALYERGLMEARTA